MAHRMSFLLEVWQQPWSGLADLLPVIRGTSGNPFSVCNLENRYICLCLQEEFMIVSTVRKVWSPQNRIQTHITHHDCCHFNHHVIFLLWCLWLSNRKKIEPSLLCKIYTVVYEVTIEMHVSHECRPFHRETKEPAVMKWVKIFLRDYLYHCPTSSWKADWE